MKNSNLGKIVFGFLSIFVMMACGLMSPGQGEGQTEAPQAAAPADEAAVSGGCGNPYFPATLNTVRTYKSSGLPSGETTITDTVTEARADGFTIQSNYGSGTKTVEWLCSPEGLRVYNTGADKAEGFSVDSGQFQLNVTFKNPSGVTLPPAIAPGDSWAQSFEFESTGEIAGSTTTSTGVSNTTYQAVGVESVTTPAGTFQAMKIQSQTKEDIQATFNGMAMNSTSEYQTIFWFAEGVGLIRSETTGSYTETVELQSYSIP
jgi:hypothetical protein